MEWTSAIKLFDEISKGLITLSVRYVAKDELLFYVSHHTVSVKLNL